MHSQQLDKVFVALQAQTSIQPIDAFIEKDRFKITSLSFGSMYLQFLNTQCIYFGCGYFIQAIADNGFSKVQIVIFDYRSENNLSLQKNEK